MQIGDGKNLDPGPGMEKNADPTIRRIHPGSATLHRHINLASFGSPASRHAWEALREQSFVDLGPSTVTLVFGAGDVKVEELCHTFPLAARSPVFQVRNCDSNLLSCVSRIK